MLLRYLLFVLFYHKTSCLDFVFIFTSLWLPYPLKPMEQRINISKAVSLFWLFQQPYNMTKVTEKVFKVDANENIEDMDIYYFTQDTSTTPVPLKKRSVTSTIPSTLLEVYSYAPLSSKENNSQMKNLTLSKSTNLTPAASQLSTTTSSTATLKSKAPTTNHKSPRLTRKLSSSPLKSLSLIPSTPQQLSQQHTCLHSLSPPCSPEQVRS